MPTPAIVFKSTELTNARTIAIILQNWDVIRERVIEKSGDESAMEAWKDGNGKEYDPRTMLQKYSMDIKSVNGKDCVKVNYSYSKTLSSGRKFVVGGGLQSFSRAVRHTLAKDLYKDYDIVNCHPVLLVQYCQKNGYSCDKIESYVLNRSSYLQDLVKVNGLEWNKVSKDWAKKVILCAVNGSMTVVPKIIKQMKHKPDWFDDFYLQCNAIKQSVVAHSDNADTVKVVKRKLKAQGKLNNLEGSVLNTILCELEDLCLSKCIEWCESQSIPTSNAVLAFDGFMLPCQYEVNLESLSDYIKNQAGYDVIFEEKPMNESIDLSGLDFTEPRSSKKIIITDDAHAASIMVEKIKNDVMVSPQNIYLRDEHIWTKDEDRIRVLLHSKCINMNFHKINSLGVIIPYSTNKGGRECIVDTVMIFLKEKPDELVEERIFNSTRGKVCFQNGVYDFNTKTFAPWSKAENVYTTIVIPRNYKPRNEAMVREVYNKVFGTIFEGHHDMMNDMLGSLACAFAGSPHQKYSVMGLGHRSSGKGVITDLCSGFGGYTSVFDAGIFQLDGMEEVRRNGVFMEMRYARLLFSNEARKDDSRKDCVLDGTMLKKIQGGDELKGRRLYENAQSFRLQGKIFHFFNDMPKFEPSDCLQNVETYSFPFKFVPATQYNEDDKLAFYRLADPNIKDYVRREDVSDAFFHLLTDFYKPERVLSKTTLAACSEVLEDCGDMEMVFKANFKIVADRDDETKAISSKEVERWVQEKKLNISAIKVKKMLVDMGAMWNRNKWYNGSKCSAYWGVIAKFKRGKESDDESDSD